MYTEEPQSRPTTTLENIIDQLAEQNAIFNHNTSRLSTIANKLLSVGDLPDEKGGVLAEPINLVSHIQNQIFGLSNSTRKFEELLTRLETII